MPRQLKKKTILDVSDVAKPKLSFFNVNCSMNFSLMSGLERKNFSEARHCRLLNTSIITQIDI